MPRFIHTSIEWSQKCTQYNSQYNRTLEKSKVTSSVTYPTIQRLKHIFRRKCGCECGGCASLKQMIHLQWETTASPAGYLLACPNYGICDTTQILGYITRDGHRVRRDELFSSRSRSRSNWTKPVPIPILFQLNETRPDADPFPDGKTRPGPVSTRFLLICQRYF